MKLKLSKLWLVIFMGTISATGPLSMDMYLPGLPAMQSYFHTSASTLQLSITFCLVGLALGQILVGPLSDRFGRRKPLIIGFLAYAITSLILVFTTNIYIFIIIRFLQGLAGATGQVLSRAVARDLYQGHELTKFYSMLMAVNGVFPIVAPLVGGILIPWIGWQGIFSLLAIIGALIVLIIWLALPETSQVGDNQVQPLSKTFNNMLLMFKRHTFIKIGLIQGLVYGSLFAYISASSFVFQSFFHMSVGQFSFLYAINGVGIIIGNNLPGRLPARIEDRDILVCGISGGLFAGILLLISLLLPPMPILVIIPLFITVVCIGIVNTVATSMAMNLEGRQSAGAASAVLGLLMNIVGAVASPLAGIMGAKSYAPLAALIFGFQMIGLILFKYTKINFNSNQHGD